MSRDSNKKPPVEMTEKSTKDFKDGMSSIENAGKMGVYAKITSLTEKLYSIANDPRVEVLMNFLELWGKFLRELNAEEAGEIAEFLFNPENIRILKATAKAFKLITEGSTSLTEKLLILNDTLKVVDDKIQIITDSLHQVALGIAAIPAQLKSLGSDIVSVIKKDFKSALKEIDWKDIIVEIIEDQF